MITEITYGMMAYRPRQTSSGLYFDTYRVSEMTGRKLDLITVVPCYVWGKNEYSLQVPAAELVDEKEYAAMAKSSQLQPAMIIAGLVGI